MTRDHRLSWIAEREHRMTLPVLALVTCVGYYLGSVIGLQLRLAPATTSVLWPPNAVLTSALVLAPPRRWHWILLAVLPVHVLIQLPTGWPLPLILALFVTNSLEAVIGAGGMHFFSAAPWRFDTLRGLTVFLLSAVIAAPVLSSFGDAAAVVWFRGEPYGRVWGNRTLSNILAELTVVPAIVGSVLATARWRRRGMWAPTIEALILAVSLCGIAWLDVSGVLGRIPTLHAVSSQMPLAVQLPFLLWAAVRFGPAGAGITVLATSILSAWAVVHGVGPFGSIAPGITVTALTLSLIMVAATLMYLATLIEERRQSQHALSTRLQFESLLSRFASALVQQPTGEMHRAFEVWLGRIARVLGIDSLIIFTPSNELERTTPLYSWIENDAGRNLEAVTAAHWEWARRSLLLQDAILMPTMRPVPPVPGPEHAAPQEVAFTSGGAIPLMAEGRVIGAIAFGAFRTRVEDNVVPANLWLVGEVLAGALRRKQFEDALKKSEAMKSAILQSLTNGVAVVDRAGCVMQFNERWRLGAHGCDWMHTTVGEDLLQTCREAARDGDQLAGKIATGIGAVLDKSRDHFLIEHVTDAGTNSRWWSLAAVPLNRHEGGAVLVCADITELRRAEMEAHRSRLELAHLARVSTVGEMTASLAHQLNQPLAAIMTNAQAAGRMLSASLPDMDGVREILRDIVNDDRRASDVIQRLSQLLRKGEIAMTRVNLTATIRDIVDLVSSESIIRNISVFYDFLQEPVFVRGDKVQLQQVILNLLHNAMEAMANQQDRPRRIVIRCREDRQRVVVSVCDSGPGVYAGSEEAVFEPFYTTKAGGMGMGLSIVRSIVEAHGGSISATNANAGGAVIQFSLEAADDTAG
jgi:signal transduction histidine kinase/integral membrane sensor domain MASE1